jgi:predicted kinase
MHRVAGRRGEASDADTGVLRGQLAADQGPISWPVLDVAGDSASVLRDAETALPALRIG